MPTYITLINFTDQGIRHFADTTKRAQAFSDLEEQLGGSLKDVYWTMGPYDAVVITEDPDDETATAASFKVSSLGNVRTTTMRAFNVEEIEAVIHKVD